MSGTTPNSGGSGLDDVVERLVVAFLRLINPLMKRALASPLHVLFSRWFVLLSFTGHKSGRRISTPVSYFRRDGTLVLTTKRPWWRSLAAAGNVDATVAGRRANRPVDLVKGERAVPEALANAPAWFLFLAALDDGRLGRADPASLGRSARRGRVVVRLGPAGTKSPEGGTHGRSVES